MRVALMSYHKNLTMYPESWIDEYRSSVLDQTYRKFDIYEVDYGASGNRIFQPKAYLNQTFESFNHVQNFLLDFLFDDGYDAVFNSNVDDKYSLSWIEKMVEQIKKGYDLVSCNFLLFDEERLIHKHENFHTLNIEKELAYDHNPICHPAVCYSRKFWERGNRYNPDDVANKNEDMRLWQRAIKNSRFIILKENLCYHRIHQNSVCHSNNK